MYGELPYTFVIPDEDEYDDAAEMDADDDRYQRRYGDDD